MKKIMAIILSAALLLGLSGCTIGVPRSEYEKVVSERDTLQSQLELLAEGGGVESALTDWQGEDGSSETLAGHQWQYELIETGGDYAFAKVTNDSGVTCGEIKATAVFYDGEDMLSTDYNYYVAVPDGRTLFFPLQKPYDENYSPVSYDRVEVSITAQPDDGYYVDCSGQIETTYNQGADNVMIKCQNNGDTEVTNVRYQVVYYNNKGGVISIMEAYNSDSIAPGGSQVMEAYLPYDWTVGNLPFDHFEVNLVEATR